MANLLIIGDSYSTFRGYVPEGYACWYPTNDRCDPNVKQVEQTWWHQVVQEAGYNLVLNNSWSGSTIGYTGYHNADNSKTSSFIYRLNQLIENGFFEQNRIDTVFVFGGTNDSCANAPLGELQFENWTKEDLYSVLPAFCCFFQRLRDTLPDAAIYCLINTHLKKEVSDALLTVSERHGITPIAFEYIEKDFGHPTALGMTHIKDAVMNVLKNA